MSNRQVAKNAVYLYLRTIVTTIVGIYTSRVVLQTLGIEDYGLYNAVGGVVGLLSFLNVALGGTTSRFITFELGKGDKQRLHDTFNSAMIVHLIIASVVLILAETIGLWFLYNKLVIPEGRVWAAQWVYQLSIISALLGVTQVPYDAVLIAHERFDVSAYISMFSTFAKLGVLYLVAYLPYDNLVSYAILILLITVFTRMFARFYCAKHFEESKFQKKWSNKIFKKMFSFSSWLMVGSLGILVNRQGRVILVNMFYGVALNAALAIANTVVGAVMGLAFNIIHAFRPSIIKAYACGDLKLFEKNVISAGTISFILFYTFSIPLILERQYILSLWLVEVPAYTSMFCALGMFFSNYMLAGAVLNASIEAVGKCKNLYCVPAIMNVFLLFFMYVLVQNDVSLFCIFLVMEMIAIFSLGNALFWMCRYSMGKIAINYFFKSVVLTSCFYCVHYIVLKNVQTEFEGSFFRLCVISLFSVLLSCLAFLIVFHKKIYMVLKQKFLGMKNL